MKIKDIVKQISVYATSPFVAFSIGAVVVMLLDVYVTKGIDSSFVSACMDVVMATTAVLVFIEAKKYLQKSLSQDGYKIALSLLNDKLLKTAILPNLRKEIEPLQANIEHYYRIGGKFKSHNFITPEEQEKNVLIKLSKIGGRLDEILKSEVFVLSQDIQFDIFRMRNTGTDFKDDSYGKFLKNHFDNFMLLTKQFEKAQSALTGLLLIYCSYRNDHLFDIDKINVPADNEKDNEYIKSIGKEFDELVELINVSRVNLNKITQDRKTVADYFNLDK